MMHHILPLTVLALAPGLPPDRAAIAGLVVNGSRHDSPLAGVEVVLRMSQGGQISSVASTVTDQKGRFLLDHLPSDLDLIYLLGANHQGIHYPGPRFRIPPGSPVAHVKLTAYDTVASPSPLVAERHEIDLQVRPGVLEIKEMLLVSNPTLTTFVGEASGDSSPITLSLSIPDGYERVTFDKQFDGQHFQIAQGRLVTDLPWTPGKRRLVFTYQVPVEENHGTFERLLDLPCQRLRVSVSGQHSKQLTCTLPSVPGVNPAAHIFESSGQTVPAGDMVRIEFGQLSLPWVVTARWAALVLLGILVVATTYRLTCRRTPRQRQHQRGLPATRAVAPRKATAAS